MTDAAALDANGPAPALPPWVLVSAGFHQRGGQSKANAALAEYLLGQGRTVHLVGHDVDPAFAAAPGCIVHRVARPLGADLLGVFRLRSRGRNVARMVLAEKPSARVLVNGGCCTWADINWVHYVHSGWRQSSPSLSRRARLKEAIAGYLFRQQEKQALQAARLVVTNSDQTRRLIVEHFGVNADWAHTIYLGSEPSWTPATAAERTAARASLGQPECRPIVLFVGGLGHDDRKGFDVLWNVWRELCKTRDWDADLFVAGGGAALDRWQQRSAQAGMVERIRFLGFTDKVRELLAGADLLISPVRYEPFGLNVQEAICRGVPSLVSACAGVVELYPAELNEMILPDPEDVRDLAVRLQAWRKDMDGWRQRFAPLSESMRRRSWRETAADIVALAENTPSAVSNSPRTPR